MKKLTKKKMNLILIFILLFAIGTFFYFSHPQGSIIMISLVGILYSIIRMVVDKVWKNDGEGLSKN